MSYKDALQGVLNEIAVMKKLDHPNVIRLHEVLDDEEKEKLYMSLYFNFKFMLKLYNICIVLDFAPHGQLIEWDEEESKFYYTNPDTVGFLSEEVLKKIFRQCITGVHYRKYFCLIHP